MNKLLWDGVWEKQSIHLNEAVLSTSWSRFLQIPPHNPLFQRRFCEIPLRPVPSLKLSLRTCYWRGPTFSSLVYPTFLLLCQTLHCKLFEAKDLSFCTLKHWALQWPYTKIIGKLAIAPSCGPKRSWVDRWTLTSWWGKARSYGSAIDHCHCLLQLLNNT